MIAGKLKERILIYSPSSPTNTDAYGTPLNDPEDVASVRAWIKADTSQETTQGEQVVGKTIYTIVIRWIDGINCKHRITWGTKTLNILGICQDERKTQLKITAVEVE